jgi:hypothetical protein
MHDLPVQIESRRKPERLRDRGSVGQQAEARGESRYALHPLSELRGATPHFGWPALDGAGEVPDRLDIARSVLPRV